MVTGMEDDYSSEEVSHDAAMIRAVSGFETLDRTNVTLDKQWDDVSTGALGHCDDRTQRDVTSHKKSRVQSLILGDH
jgi:hypothetical protein